MRFLSDRRFVTVLRIALGVLFIVAALPKLQDPVGFAKAVDNYRMVPDPVERVMALVLPPLELIVGVLLIVGIADAGASLLTLGMMILFTVAVGVAVARNLDITCGCFAVEGDTPIGLWKILENLGFLLGAVFLFLLSQKQKRIKNKE